MPISKAPYKRTYEHTKARGKEYRVRCDLCGGLYPRYKTFTAEKIFSLSSDPLISKNVLDEKFLNVTKTKFRVCPKCARFLGIVQPGKSVRKKLPK